VTVLRSGSATDVGRVRHANQDLPLEGENLFAVADGMGGHAGGEVAARVAVDALRSAFARQPSIEGLREAVAEANAAVWRASQVQSDLRGMGTTLTAAALVAGTDGRDVVALANVGDSRAYLYSGGRITQVTDDHSLAEEKVRKGELTEAEAAVHPHRHILTRALGVSSDVDVDLWEMHLRDGDRILICSDGLTNEVGISQIADVLGSVTDPHEAAELLVRAANEHGGNDNITVVVVDVLVGEQGKNRSTVIAPVVGGTAGAGIVLAADGPAGAKGSTVAPGARVPAPPDGTGEDSMTGVVPSQPAAPPGPGETGTTRRLTPAPVPQGPEPPAGEGIGVVGDEVLGNGVVGPGRVPSERKLSRGERRRRAGIPRRVTFRVIGFFLLLAAVLAGAYALLRWYANDDWYVTLNQNQIVVYQGHPGGILWFKPKIVDRTGVTTNDVVFIRIPQLQQNVEEPSLGAAEHYVQNLQNEKAAQQQINNGSAGGGTTTTAIGPTGTFPSTTVPPPVSGKPGAPAPFAPPTAAPPAATTAATAFQTP